jgi:hypothetical protein
LFLEATLIGRGFIPSMVQGAMASGPVFLLIAARYSE